MGENIVLVEWLDEMSLISYFSNEERKVKGHSGNELYSMNE